MNTVDMIMVLILWVGLVGIFVALSIVFITGKITRFKEVIKEERANLASARKKCLALLTSYKDVVFSHLSEERGFLSQIARYQTEHRLRDISNSAGGLFFIYQASLTFPQIQSDDHIRSLLKQIEKQTEELQMRLERVNSAVRRSNDLMASLPYSLISSEKWQDRYESGMLGDEEPNKAPEPTTTSVTPRATE